MIKKLVYLSLMLLATSPTWAIIGVNDSLDINIADKNGTFGIDTYLRYNYSMMYGYLESDGSGEIGGKQLLRIDLPELRGIYFKSDLLFAFNPERYAGAEFQKMNNVLLHYGEAYLGFQNKYTSLKIGFQNLVSSDGIYNHLLLDDYSGPMFGLKWNIWLTRFWDLELIYSFIRPHNATWFNSIPDKDNSTYNGLYGKSLFTKKINFRPLPWIRLGVTESVYFLGQNFNIWFMNPFTSYFLTLALNDWVDRASGGTANLGASDIKVTFDWNIGFNGWRFYGEIMVDDSDFYFVRNNEPVMPSRVGFMFGGELRGYLFTRYFKLPPVAEFLVSNLYVNCEYATVSKYTYSRDDHYSYEYVRYEQKERFDPANPFPTSETEEINRIGNFLGFMLGPNADSVDFAIGWRNDLKQVKDYRADYQGDIYFDSFKTKRVVDRLFKVQLHYKHYRLGDERDVTIPFYANEHYLIDGDDNIDVDFDGNPSNDASNRVTEWVRIVETEVNIFDISVYSDIFKFSRFVLGAETRFNFEWETTKPYTSLESTNFTYRWEFGIILTW
jgi:hypothetical protein